MKKQNKFNIKYMYDLCFHSKYNLNYIYKIVKSNINEKSTVNLIPISKHNNNKDIKLLNYNINTIISYFEIGLYYFDNKTKQKYLNNLRKKKLKNIIK